MNARTKPEVDLGRLSAAERDLIGSPMLRILAERLADQADEARGMIEHYRRTIDNYGRTAPWALLQEYADWTAKLALVRDRQERMGLEGIPTW